VLSTAPLSSINEFIQRSVSVTDRLNHTAPIRSSEADAMGLDRPTGLRISSVKKIPTHSATNSSAGATVLNVYRPTGVMVTSTKKRPNKTATKNSTDATKVILDRPTGLTATSVKKRPNNTATHHTVHANKLGEYRPPVANYSSIGKLPLPLQVIEQYKQWHSVDALLRNDTAGRKYSIAFYQCPLQAGNRMHHFLNGFLWAVLTNRTMLWKYYDRRNCLRYGKLYSPQICQSANTAKDCSKVLLRAPWIPSYDEWARKLNLAKPVEFPFRSTHPKSVASRHYPWKDGDEKFYGADNEKKYPHQVAVFVQNVGKFSPFETERIRNETLVTLRGRESAKYLYSFGTYFLFGMLHRSAFDFANHIRANEGALIKQNAVSVAVHSRHVSTDVDGCNISKETNCMQKIIDNSPTGSINVRVMSDRECTISRMKDWLGKRNISVAVAQHDKYKDFSAEHGPYAGAGFYQDLALASTARSHIVAMKRTSSDLMLELVVFNTKMDAWRAGEDVKTANVEVCFMGKG
jgi:hypothetical protein